MEKLSETVTDSAEDVLPKTEGNSCYLDMDEDEYAYSSAVWLFPDGTFRSAPYTYKYVDGEKKPYKEHTMVYKEIFEPIRDRFRYTGQDDKPDYPETSDEINKIFERMTNAIRIRCRQSKKNNQKELLVDLNIDNAPTDKQFRSIHRELCRFDYDLFYYDLTDSQSGKSLWVRTFGGDVTPTCGVVFRDMKKTFDRFAQSTD